MRYPPDTSCPFVQLASERHLHSLRVRGYRYTPLQVEPRREDYVAHLTDRRLVLVPLAADAPAGDASEALPAPIALPWNDLIEIRTAAGSRLVETLPGAEEHMLLIEAKARAAHEFAEMFLFTVEPVAGARPDARAQHSAPFVEIVEELLFEAYGA